MEDIKNAPDDTVPVPVEDHIKLTKQTALPLGQASKSISYNRRLQILKTLIKDPQKKQKIFLKKRQIYFKKAIKIFLAKSSDRMLLKQNPPRKELWRFSLVEVVALLLLPRSPFTEQQ